MMTLEEMYHDLRQKARFIAQAANMLHTHLPERLDCFQQFDNSRAELDNIEKWLKIARERIGQIEQELEDQRKRRE